MTSGEKIKKYLDDDLDRLEALMIKYPDRIPVEAVSEFLYMKNDSLRAAIECGSFGLAWRKSGKANKAYCIPTAQFVRWYLGVGLLEKCNCS